jgi:hypothetical protein
MKKIDIDYFNHIYLIYRNRLPSSIKNKMYSIGLDKVKQYGYALDFVPKELRDHDMYMTAVTQDGEALKYVPKELRDYDICIAAVKRNGGALEYVPEELRSRIEEELGL